MRVGAIAATTTLRANRLSAREDALFQAARSGDHRTARSLLEGGVCAEVHDRRGDTPLVCAARNGRVAAMRTLFEAGAALDRPDSGRTRWPALMHALQADQTTSALVLLEWGADADVRDDAGYTALMMAASRGDRWVVSELLARGADPGGELFLGFTALDYAIGYGHASVVRVLLDAAPELKERSNAARRSVLALARDANDDEVLALVVD